MNKHILKAFIPAAALMLLAGCSKEHDELSAPEKGGIELVLMPGVGTHPGSRAAHNYKAADYFTLAGYDKTDVIVGNTTSPYVYNNISKELTAEPGTDPFVFPADGSPLDITVKWPTEAQRRALDAAGHKDQSTTEAFLLADFLTKEIKALPAERVIINLAHERCKATFTLDGALYGQKIEKLSLNGYSAYCDPALNDAQLILLPAVGSVMLTTGTHGALKVQGDPQMYTFALTADVTGIEAGSHHTIRLNLN